VVEIFKYIRIFIFALLVVIVSACSAKETASVNLGLTKLSIVTYNETGKTSKVVDKDSTKKAYRIIQDAKDVLKKDDLSFRQERTHAFVFKYGKENIDNYFLWVIPSDNKAKPQSVIVEKEDYKHYKLSEKDSKKIINIVSK